MFSAYLLSCARGESFQTRMVGEREKEASESASPQRSISPPAGDAEGDDSTVPDEPSPASPGSSPDSVGSNSVLSQLEQMISNDDWVYKQSGEKRRRHRLDQVAPKLTDVSRSVVTSYSLKAYVELLSSHHRSSIASWLYANTAAPISALFRFPNASLLTAPSEEGSRGCVKEAARLALRARYPELGQRGFQAFVDAPPIVYVSPALHHDVAHALAQEFGIADVVIAPKAENLVADVEGRIDGLALGARMAADVAEGKKPLLVVAVVGSAVFGQNDFVSALLQLRQTHGFWLHVVGQGLAALALRQPSEQLVNVLQQVDSMSLPLAQWIGLPALQTLVLHRSIEGYRQTFREKLDSLHWWVAIHQLSPKRITDHIENANELGKVMLKQLSLEKRVHLLGIQSTAEEYTAKVLKGHIFAPTVLIFKYNFGESASGTELKDLSEDEREYLDSVNSWLGQGLISECPQVGLHLVELASTFGTAFRFCPLESAAFFGTTASHIDGFMQKMKSMAHIVDATLAARRRLPTVLADFPSLRRVAAQKWAGVGVLNYVPAIVHGTAPEDWSPKQCQQVSHLNIELVHSLRDGDSAFSTGESSDGVACVKFGMLADEKDLNDLVALVAERGKRIEESSQYLESLAEMVRQGIEAANQDLKKESEDRLVQEGVLRQLPMVGSFMNWLAPLPKEAAMRGRTFDLKTGRIHSTDVIYKHKLQMEAGDMDGPLTPATPIDTPQVPHGVAGQEPVMEPDSDEPKPVSTAEEAVEEPEKPVSTEE